MRFLGIDYGGKRVGIAISSEDNRLAFPKKVLPNDRNLVKAISDFCLANRVSKIILGESTNFAGEPNPIMKKVLVFKERLEKISGLPVHFEPEFMTSQEAGRIQGEKDSIDASAAAIILRSYLDRQK